jgi:hypothetical protein
MVSILALAMVIMTSNKLKSTLNLPGYQKPKTAYCRTSSFRRIVLWGMADCQA